ncbi:MAG TPA: SusC/RagA family TonB-linked outer membrane protein [Bacteroidia bacterium]|nr:SusC/RagA family TonB-linked outer membrane protein [Bacteroidia bacterium]
MKRKIVLFSSLFMLLQVVVFAQSKTIKGTVKDSKTDETIPGATVMVEGNPASATPTDINGAFTINVEGEGKKLVITFMGYESKTVDANKDVIDVALSVNTTLLKETVVTALGIPKEKKSIGYAVSEVKAGDIAKSGEQNAIQALAGKAAGIQVTSSGGTPGASSKITLRGNSTFTGQNQPLIVVDGSPIDNETNAIVGDNPFNTGLNGVNNSNRALDINPDDIESVSILKGPAAAALYGARAGAGAILYTTKKGKFRKGLGVTLSSSVELQKVNKLPEQQTKYAQGAASNGKFLTADPGPDNVYGTPDDVTAGTPQSWGPTLESLGMTPYDNTKNFYQTGTTYTNNLSIDGGTENTTYRFSYSNMDNTGVMRNSYLKRNTIRVNADHKLSQKLTTGVSVSYVNTKSQLPQNGSTVAGPMLGLMRTPVSFNLSDYQYENGFNKTYFGGYDNPYYSIYKNPFNQSVNRVLGNAYLTYKPLEWLDVTYRLGLDNYSDYSRQVYAMSSNGYIFTDDQGYQKRLGEIDFNTLNSMTLNSDLTVAGHKKFGENWNTSLILGNNLYHNETKTIFSRGRKLSVPEFYNLSNASDLYTNNVIRAKRTYAYYADASIDYKSMVFLGLTGRNEWSSTFGTKKNNFFYPGVNAAFVISEAVKLPKWFSFAKVRAAYAESGISPQPYSAKTYFGTPIYTDSYTDGNTFPYLGNNGYAIFNTIGSSNLTPERVKGREFGTDLRFFQGRLNLDVTYYHQKTFDILIQRPISPSSGYTGLFSNSGQMENKGWEIALSGKPVDRENFKWEINVTWAKNKSKVLKLAEGVDELNIEAGFTQISSYAIVGQPYGAFYGTAYQRNSEGKLIIGADGLPVVDPKSKNLGNPYPDWLSGIRNTFTYKQISFSFLWDIRKGGKIWNGTYQRMLNVGTAKESAENREGTFVIDGVMSGGQDADGYEIATNTPNTKEISAANYYRNYLGDGRAGGSASETGIQDGSWVRLRDISISYRLNLAAKSKYIQYIDLSVTGRNALLFTKYKGVDPETSLTGAGSNIQGFDYFNNPGTKSIFFGVKLGF